MQHSTLIDSLRTYLNLWIYRLLSPLTVQVSRHKKIFLFCYVQVWELTAGTLTDGSIMVMTKSCLYQTQHSGLTMTANGHICHSTKMSAPSVCAACVCVYTTRSVRLTQQSQRANWCRLLSWKYFYWQGEKGKAINDLMGLYFGCFLEYEHWKKAELNAWSTCSD